MSAILAYRISQFTPITFSISMNDYGFELLSDQPIPVDDSNVRELFTTDNLLLDIQKSMNSTEMAQKKVPRHCGDRRADLPGHAGRKKESQAPAVFCIAAVQSI
jgi:Lhr-like helicase